MRLYIPTFALLLCIPLKAIAAIIPVYYEAVITDVSSKGTLLDIVGLDPNEIAEFKVGANINGTLNIEDTLLFPNPDNTGSDFADYDVQSSPIADIGGGGFVSGKYTDGSDKSFDTLRYRTGDTDSFSIKDHSQEGMGYPLAKSQLIHLNVEDSTTNFIFSGDYNDLVFELFNADIFSGSMFFDSVDQRDFNTYAFLSVNFDLTYLRVRDVVPEVVSEPQVVLLSTLFFLILFRQAKKPLY